MGPPSNQLTEMHKWETAEKLKMQETDRLSGEVGLLNMATPGREGRDE